MWAIVHDGLLRLQTPLNALLWAWLTLLSIIYGFIIFRTNIEPNLLTPNFLRYVAH